MRIKGFVDTSFVDWDGKIVSTVFVPTCNFRCPFCFNHDLILHPERYPNVAESSIFNFLKRNRDFLDGVCISGGEPTTARGLEDFCRSVTSLGLKVKLDTNGSDPRLLARLVSRNLISYVAMDIKAPPNARSYKLAAGLRSGKPLRLVSESVSFLLSSDLDYEFRTTVIPSIHSERDIEEIASWIQGAKLYVLQKFQPQKARSRRLRKLSSQSDSEMEHLAAVARKYVSKVKWRGR